MDENMEEGAAPAHSSKFPVIDSTSVVTIIWNEDNTEFACIFCKRYTVDELALGPLYRLPEEGVVTHYFCLLFSAALVQKGDDRQGILGFLPADILKEARRAQRLKCSFCHTYGASIGCNTSRCKISFHYPCGIENDASLQFLKNYEAYCKAHATLPPVAEGSDERQCPICLSPVDHSERPIVGPCCKNAVFHKLCIQRMALDHGYFFKCPTCNSDANFPDSAKLQGIFVPEQDAAWEREPDAFQELYQQYNHCDAEVCECPKGRDYGANKGAWLLARCHTCGSAGTHRQCGKLATINEWGCSSCLEIAARTEARKATEPPTVMPPPIVEEPQPSTSAASFGIGKTSSSSVQKLKNVTANNSNRKSKVASVGVMSKKSGATNNTKNTNASSKSAPVNYDKTESKNGSKRARRTGVPVDSPEFENDDDNDDDFDLSAIHIQPSCRDYFPHTKETKAKFAMKFGSLPDWRNHYLKVQMVDIFLDADKKKEKAATSEPIASEEVSGPISNGGTTRATSSKKLATKARIGKIRKSKSRKRNSRRATNWSKGRVKRKKKVSAPKIKSEMKSRHSAQTTVGRSSAASQAVLVGIRRSQESLLQLQAQSTGKADDVQSLANNSNEVSGAANGRQSGTELYSPNASFRQPILPNSTNGSHQRDKRETSPASNESSKTTCPSSSSGSSLSINGTAPARIAKQSQSLRSDKPVVKIEPSEVSISSQAHGEDTRDTSQVGSSNGQPSMEVELQQSAEGIARTLLNLGPNEANAHMKILEMNCPQLFKSNSS